VTAATAACDANHNWGWGDRAIPFSGEFSTWKRREPLVNKGSYGWKLKFTTTCDSCEAGTHFQLATASWAALENMALPPNTSLDLATPFGDTVTRSFTLPSRFIPRAKAG